MRKFLFSFAFLIFAGGAFAGGWGVAPPTTVATGTSISGVTTWGTSAVPYGSYGVAYLVSWYREPNGTWHGLATLGVGTYAQRIPSSGFYAVPSFPVSTAGTYTIAIYSSMSSSVSGTPSGNLEVQQNISVVPANSAPTVSWVNNPSTAYVNQWFNIQARGDDPDGNISYVYVWRDGQPFAFNGFPSGYTQYSDNNGAMSSVPGTITFMAQSGDASGASSGYIYHTVTIINRPPLITMSATPTTIEFGQSTNLTSVATDADGNLAFHGILVLNEAGTDWYRSASTDHSTGWGNHPTTNDFTSISYTSGVTSGASSTRTAVHRPSYTGLPRTITYHNNAYDGYVWASSDPANWAACVGYAFVTLIKATPTQSGWVSQSWTGTGTALAGSFNVVVSNPYSSAVTAPTGTPTFSVVGASGAGAYPTSGAVDAGTSFYPGIYTVRCSYSGDTNYNPRDWDVTFTVINTAPTAGISIKGISSGTTTGVMGEVLTIGVSGSDTDGNLRAVNLWVLTPSIGWRNIRADSTMAAGYTENATTDNAINSAANVSTLGSANRTFSILLGGGTGTYQFVTRSMDASGVASASQQVNVTVSKASQSALTLNAVGTQSYGTAQILSTTGGSGSGAVSYAIVGQSAAGVATLSGTTLTANTSTGWVDLQATEASDGDYNATTSSTVRVAFAKAVATITLGNLNPTYDGTAKAAAVNTAPTGLAVTITYNGFTTAPTNAGSYTVVATINDVNYAGSANGTLVINPAPVTFTFSNLGFFYDAQVKAPTIVINPASATTAITGTSYATIGNNYSFTITGTGNYVGSGTCNWTIGCCPATINLGNLNFSYNGTAKVPTYTTSPVALSVAFTYNGSSTAPTNVGSYAVVATVNSPADANGQIFVGSTTGTLVISKATLTVAANNASRTYGAANPAFAATYTGFVNGETAAVLTGVPSLTTSATTASPLGAYPITAAAGTLAATNYQFTFVNGTLTVSKATLTVAANNASRTYGASNPAFTSAYSGFVNGETASVLSGTPALTTAATTTSVVGTYPITAAVGTLAATNYQFTFVDGTLTVGKATLTVTANNAGRIYGAANPAFTSVIVGFVNGETASVLAGAPSLATAATPTSNVGVYAITPAVGTLAATNYQFTFVNGTLTISKAMLIVTTNNSRTYGASNAFYAVYTGFINGDTSAVLTGTPSLTTTATIASGVGVYPTTVAAGTLAATNYQFTFVNGTLTVSPASLTVTANNTSRAYGVANPVFIAAYAGFVNGETSAILSGAPSLATTATTASVVGAYPIISGPGTLVAANYKFSCVNATLTITKASQPSDLAITSANTAGLGIAYTATASGGIGAGNYVWTLSPNSTAPGAGINSATGLVSATGVGTVLFICSRAGDAYYNASVSTPVFTLNVATDYQPPTVPSGLSARSTDLTAITLTWLPSGDNSGGTITYEIFDAASGVFLGSTTGTTWVHTGLTADRVYLYKIRANDPSGNLSAFSVTVMATPASQTFGVDTDGDGMPDAWETANGLNPNSASDASLDPDGDGLTNLEEYKLGLNPHSATAFYLTNTPQSQPQVQLYFRALGAGTVTIQTQSGSIPPITYTFLGTTGGWETPNGGAAIDCRVPIVNEPILVNSTVSNFYISVGQLSWGATYDPTDYTINGLYVNQISKSDAGGSFTIEANRTRVLAFASSDLEPLGRFTSPRIGLGSDARGRSAGTVVLTNPCYAPPGPFNSYTSIETGPATLWHLSHPTHEQALAPSGLVDIQRESIRTSIRFYAGMQFTKTGEFYDLPTGLPDAYYQLDTLDIATTELTRMIGGDTYIYRVQVMPSGHVFVGSYTIGQTLVNYYQDTWTTRQWGWRRPDATLPGVVEYVKSYSEHINAPGSTFSGIAVAQIVHTGSDVSSAICYQENVGYQNDDAQLFRSPVGHSRGIGTDTCIIGDGISNYISSSAAWPLAPCSYSYLNTGGRTQTMVYNLGVAWGVGSNLGTQPIGALGQPSEKWASFGDTVGVLNGGGIQTAAVPSDLVTTYSYADALGGAKTLVSDMTTKQGTTQIGRKTFAYSLGSLNSNETEITVQTDYASAASPLVTTTTVYSARILDKDFRDRPVSRVKPDNTKVSSAYQRGTLAGSAWTADVNGKCFLVAELSGKVGTGVSTYRGISIDPLDMDPAKSTLTERILDANGSVLCESTCVFQSGGSFALVSSIYSQYDALGNVVQKADQPIAADGTTTGRILYQAAYVGFKKVSECDAAGVLLTTTYDAYGQIATQTRASAGSTANGDYIPAQTKIYTHDTVGHVLSETVNGLGTSEQLVTSSTFDTAGRVVSGTVPGGFTTATNYTGANSMVTQITVTNPDGGTKITNLYLDGSLKSVTGTAVPDSATTYAYDAATGNLKTSQTTAGQTGVQTSDWIGRAMSSDASTWAGGTRTNFNNYNTLGQLKSQDITVGGTKVDLSHLYEYDAYGRLYREGLDNNGNGVIEPSADLGVKEYEFAYQTGAPGYASNLYLYSGQKIWPYAGTNAGTFHYAVQNYTQVSGLTYAATSHTVALDFDGNTVDTTVTVNRAGAGQVNTTTASGSSQSIIQTMRDGLLTSSTNAQGQQVIQTYDELSRPESSSDPRIGTTSLTYVPNSMLVFSVTTPDLNTAYNSYDPAGRVASQTNNLGKVAFSQYDQAGNLTYSWGDTVNPVRYESNELGQQTKMHTYRSGTWTGSALPSGFTLDGDVTTWTYQATTGLLTSKQDASMETTAYEYESMGRASKRTDARGWVTNYTYTAAGQPWVTSYTDGLTPSITYGYDRASRLQSVTDGSGQRAFGYYDSGADALNQSAKLQSETLPAYFGSHGINYSYQFSVAGRVNGAASSLKLDTGSLYSVGYAYDSVGRFSTLSYNTATPFTYGYVANSNLVGSVAQSTTGYSRAYTYDPASNRVTNLKNLWSSLTASTVETRLTYDALGQRQTEKIAGTGYMTALGRPTELGVHQDYTYTDRSELDSSAKYVLAAGWAVGGLSVGTDREFNYDPIGNRTSDIIGGVAGSYVPNALNQYSSAPTTGSMTYDGNGNLASDGTRSYAYDGENRLITVTQGASTWHYEYDYLNRRIRKWGSGLTEQRFIYDGWNLIAETDASGTLTRRYAWGLDVSGTSQGAGGVGGLLLIQDGANQYYPLYDASHSVIGLYNASGGIDSAYEYDPFGRTQTSAGIYAATNPFRYSTKYTDNETGFAYYGLRYYSPLIGRFINRDPIQEAGGINLYGFCGNNGVNHWDVLGQDWGWLQEFTESFSKLFVSSSPADNSSSGTSDSGSQTTGRTSGESHYENGADGKPTLVYDKFVVTLASDNSHKSDESLPYDAIGAYNRQNAQANQDAPNSVTGTIASTDPTFGLGGIRTATTTVQVLGRQVNGAPSGDLHGALLITGDGRAIVVSAQPSGKIHGWTQFENLLGMDVGITISPQVPASPDKSGEFTQYQNSSTHDASSVFFLNQSFNQTVAQVTAFNSAVSSQNVSYLTRTQNSNSYAFTLLQVLTGTPYSAPSNYYGGRTWIPTPAAPTAPHGP